MVALDHVSDQFIQQINAMPEERGFIAGEHARSLFRQANIRQWHADAPHLGRSEGYIDYNDVDWRTGKPYMMEIDPEDVLHTSQRHLHGPTLVSMLTHGVRRHQDHPVQTYESARGDTWIEEGHHRLVTRRLQGLVVMSQHGREHWGRRRHYA